MALRIFRDRTGEEWRVWDVMPAISAERRQQPTRRISAVPYPGPERRTVADRRAEADRRARQKESRGWLCFESGEVKKRLAPIPGDWDRCPDEEIETLLQKAGTSLRGRD